MQFALPVLYASRRHRLDTFCGTPDKSRDLKSGKALCQIALYCVLEVHQAAE